MICVEYIEDEVIAEDEEPPHMEHNYDQNMSFVVPPEFIQGHPNP